MFTTHHPTRMIVRSALFAVLLLGAAMPVRAQRMDSTRAGISPSQPSPPTRIARPAVRPDTTDLGPPISPRRAFLYSFLLPGAGQAKLDRAYAGGMFFLIEAAALTLLHRSAEDLRIARAFQGDSMPLRYQIDPVTGLATRDAGGAPVSPSGRRRDMTPISCGRASCTPRTGSRCCSSTTSSPARMRSSPPNSGICRPSWPFGRRQSVRCSPRRSRFARSAPGR